jgi:putative transposase
MTERRAWRRAVYEVIQTMMSSLPQGQVTIERLCRLARVSRAGYYRLWQASAPRQHDTAVRDAIQRVVLANGRYRRGYRYITRQLRHDGLIVNHKRVLRLMREDNLLGLRRRPFVPSTTQARHPWPVVPNRARDMQHEPGRQSLRQRQGRALHQNPQKRRDRRHPLSRSPRRGGPHRRLHPSAPAASP